MSQTSIDPNVPGLDMGISQQPEFDEDAPTSVDLYLNVPGLDLNMALFPGFMANGVIDPVTEGPESLVSARIVGSDIADFDGWVLEIVGTFGAPSTTAFSGPVGPHVDYPLDPDGTPKVTLAVSGITGFARSGGQAVADVNRTTALTGMKPLRQTWPVSTQADPVIDDTDLGGGQRRVRLALSDRIPAGATVACTFADGWRTGLTGGTISVTNNSTRAAVPPICRWATPPYQLITGSKRIDILAASHYARHDGADLHQAVAAIRWFASDGTTLKSGWIVAPSNSTEHGHTLRCWGFNLDPTGFTSGVISVWAHVYPWQGAVRYMGSSATTVAGHSTATTIGMAASVENNLLHLCYDSDGARYDIRWVVLDPVNGTTTASATMVATSLAGAKAIAPASKPLNVSTAAQALRLVGRTLPAANGLTAKTNACDWWNIVLPVGTSVVGSTAQSSGNKATEGRMVIRGDPDDANPRANCLLATATAHGPTLNCSRWLFRDCTLSVGEYRLISSLTTNPTIHLENVTVQGRAGFEASAVSIFTSGTMARDYSLLTAANVLWYQYGLGIGGSVERVLLLRNTQCPRSQMSVVFADCEQIYDATVDYVGITEIISFRGTASSGASGFFTGDHMAWGCRAERNHGTFYQYAPANEILTAASLYIGSNTEPMYCYRAALVNCLAIRASVKTDLKIGEMGENAFQNLLDSIIAGCIFAGNRLSIHNDSPKNPDVVNLTHRGNMISATGFDSLHAKGDTFSVGELTASSIKTGGWEISYAVGCDAIVNTERNTVPYADYALEQYPLRSYREATRIGPGTVGAFAFVNDQSNYGVNAVPIGVNGVGAGGGDYRPGAGSQLRGRGRVAQIDVDLDGVARGTTFDVGPLERAA